MLLAVAICALGGAEPLRLLRPRIDAQVLGQHRRVDRAITEMFRRFRGEMRLWNRFDFVIRTQPSSQVRHEHGLRSERLAELTAVFCEVLAVTADIRGSGCGPALGRGSTTVCPEGRRALIFSDQLCIGAEHADCRNGWRKSREFRHGIVVGSVGEGKGATFINRSGAEAEQECMEIATRLLTAVVAGKLR